MFLIGYRGGEENEHFWLKLSVSIMLFGGKKLCCKYCLTGEHRWILCQIPLTAFSGDEIFSSQAIHYTKDRVFVLICDVH